MAGVMRGVVLVAWLGGCGADAGEPPPTDGEGGSADVWQWDGCEPGYATLPDGTCAPAAEGAGAVACAAGFELADGGCAPILPAAPCGGLMLAIPGETACREIAPCPGGPWGAIPDAPDTEYVDATFAGASNGSQAAPWSTVADAIGAAAAGAVVALAAGSYDTAGLTVSQPQRLWGRCPQMTALVGGVIVASAGVELRDLSIEAGGAQSAVGVIGGAALLDRVRVHDSPIGASVQGSASSLVLSRSLIDNNGFGTACYGAAVTVDASALRDCSERALQSQMFLGLRCNASVERSVVERITRLGMLVEGSDLSLAGVVIRDIELVGTIGYALQIQLDEQALTRSSLSMWSTVVERAADTAVNFSGSDGTIEDSVVRDTQPLPDGRFGRGVLVGDNDASGETSDVLITHSLIERNGYEGVLVSGGALAIDASILRDTLPSADGKYGRGAAAQHSAFSSGRTSLTVRGSVVVNNTDIGVAAFGVDLLVEGSFIAATQPQPFDGRQGRGINLQPIDAVPCDGVVRASVLEQNAEAAIYSTGSALVVESTLVQDTQGGVGGVVGVGLALQTPDPAMPPNSARVSGSWLRANKQAGLFAFDSNVQIEGCLVEDHVPEIASGLFGDGIQVVASGAVPVSALIDRSRILGGTRAGFTLFGPVAATLSDSALRCNPIDLAGQSAASGAPTLSDGGNVTCGCGDGVGICKLISASLEPPSPLY